MARQISPGEAYYLGSKETAAEGLLNCAGFHLRNQLTESSDGIIIVLVGLPGRGKSFISRKIEGFMKWQCRETRTFNVGKYRRDGTDTATSGRADFYDAGNEDASRMRREAAERCLNDALQWLDTEDGEVAIFDATNTTSERRQMIVDTVTANGNQYHVLFVEIICDDPAVLHANYKNKVMYSPDFKGMSMEEAIADLKSRVQKYEDRYQPIDNDSLSYIKLYNMSSKVMVNRIFGHSAKSLLPFLMGVHIGTRPVWLVRTAKVPAQSRSDAELSEEGQAFAERLGAFMIRRMRKFYEGKEMPKKPVRVMSSTIPSCVQTAYAALASVPELQYQAFKQTSALNPIDRGVHSGSWWTDLSTDKPPWSLVEQYDKEFYDIWQENKLLSRFPGGESYYDIMCRCESTLLELEMSTTPVLCVSHMTLLQVFLSYFKDIPLEDAWDISVPEHTVFEITPTLGGGYIIENHSVEQEELPDSPGLKPRGERKPTTKFVSGKDPTVLTPHTTSSTSIAAASSNNRWTPKGAIAKAKPPREAAPSS